MEILVYELKSNKGFLPQSLLIIKIGEIKFRIVYSQNELLLFKRTEDDFIINDEIQMPFLHSLIKTLIVEGMHKIIKHATKKEVTNKGLQRSDGITKMIPYMKKECLIKKLKEQRIIILKLIQNI